jgi:transcriptional regulator GlxA family with amidase domain
VATHWLRADRLRRSNPLLEVDDDAIFVNEGRVWTSAGVTAGIDLALALVEVDLGADVAQMVARILVVFLRRPGGQSQFAPSVWSGRADSAPIRTAQSMIDTDPGAVGSISELAAAVGLSPRHFSRRFTDEVGQTPGRYLESVRVEAARALLERDGASVDHVARACGFGSAEALRRSFHRRLGTSPNSYRHRFAGTHAG